MAAGVVNVPRTAVAVAEAAGVVNVPRTAVAVAEAAGAVPPTDVIEAIRTRQTAAAAAETPAGGMLPWTTSAGINRRSVLCVLFSQSSLLS